MRCRRCHGLMLEDRLIDMQETGSLWIEVLRCCNCGNVYDSEIGRYQELQRQGIVSESAKGIADVLSVEAA
jgi:uncharacterized Zn finger protein